MATTSPVLIATIVANAIVCIAALCVWYTLRSHLRTHHPLVWSRFRFPRSGVDDEKAETLADIGLAEYLRGEDWRSLGDARLERLIKTRRTCFYAACVTMTAALAAFLLPLA
jgi:hypothetical protein